MVGDPLLNQNNTRSVAVLQQASQILVSSKDASTVLQQLLLLLRNHLAVSRCAVYLFDDASTQILCQAQSGYPEEALPHQIPLRENHAVSLAFRTRMTQVAELAGPGTQDLITPLISRDQSIGALLTGTADAGPFAAEDLSHISHLAAATAACLENIRLHNAERLRFRQLELLRLMTRSAATASEGSQLYSTLADLLGDSFDGAQVALILCPPQSDLSLAGYTGADGPPMERVLQSRQSGFLGQALRHRAPVIVQDFKTATTTPSCYPDSGSELYIPLVAQQQVLGCFLIAQAKHNAFPPEAPSLAQAAADIAAIAVSLVRLRSELDRLAGTDPLTGCYNQHHFHAALTQEVSRAHRAKKPFGLVLLDLRSFGEVNTHLGVEAGDRLLQQISASLRSRLRSHDILCRYIGDRFAILLPEVNADVLPVVLAKLHAALHNLEIRTTPPRPVSASWAAASFPQDAGNETDLMKTLLSRLDHAKHQKSATPEA